MCDITPLVTFDVFSSGPGDDRFTLNKTCSQITNPFNQYCLLPPTERLVHTTTCSPTLQNPRLPFVFPDAIAGNLRSLQDLPRVFESFPKNDSAEMWIVHTDDVANRVIDYSTFRYTGFHPISQQVSSVAMSTTNLKLICLASTDNTGQTFQLYSMDQYGLLRMQVSPNGGPLSVPAQDSRQRCFCNTGGTTLFALLLNELYQPLSAPPNTWDLVPSVAPGIQDVLMNQDASFVALQYLTSIVFLRSQTFFPPVSFPNGVLFATLTVSQQHLLVCSFQSPNSVITVIPVQTGVPIFAWNVASAGGLVPNDIYYAIATGNFAPTAVFDLIVSRELQPSMRITLSVPAGTATISPLVQPVILEFIGTDAWMQQSSNNLYFVNGTNVPITPGTPTALWASPDQSRIYGFFQEQLWMLPVDTTTWTQSPSAIYMGFDCVVEDEYKTSFPIEEMWYWGFVFVNVPADLVVNTTVIGTSRHLLYRIVVNELHAATTNFFAFVTLQIQRINNYLLLTNGEETPRLFENANVLVGNLWSTNTPDQSSDPDSFVQWISTAQPLVTTNGIYILFLNNDAETVRVVYNVFNLPQFAQWCTKDPEYLSRAIESQSNFCFDHLVSHDGKSFFDPRCACIGGSRLLNLLYPAATLDSVTSGRLQMALPCVINDCAQAFALGPENTNAYAFTQQSCKQDITMCSDIVSLESGTNIDVNKMQVIQNCGQDPTACRSNEECPIGTVCLNGQCVVSCTADATCQSVLADPLATCNTSTGQCLYGSGIPKGNSGSSTASIVVIVVLSILILIMFVLFFAFFVDTKKKPKVGTPSPSTVKNVVK